MKKLALLFAGLSLLVTTGCNNNDESVIEYQLVGIWQPTKEVVTTVEVGEDPISDVITYNNCELESRWRFNEGTTGKRTDRTDDPVTVGQCMTDFDRTFTYVYNKDDKSLEIRYQGVVEPQRGKIVTLNATTLNYAVEEYKDATEYVTRTYTFKRIPQ